MSFVRIGIHPNLSEFVIWPGSSQPGQHTKFTRRALPRDRRNSSSAVIPTRTAGPSLGNRKDTRAHAPGVSTLFQIAPSPAPFVRPPLFLRLPTRCTRSGHHRSEHPQACCNFPCPACRNTATTPGSDVLGVGTFYPANWLSAPPNHTSPNHTSPTVTGVCRSSELIR